MPLIDEKDTYSKGYLSPSRLENDKEYKFRALGYKKTEGGKFPDSEGFTTEYEFEVIDEDMKASFARDDGSITFTCNSKRMRRAFFVAGVEEGDLVTIKKTGEGFKTNYEVNKVE